MLKCTVTTLPFATPSTVREAHLCRILTKYAAYYNELRTHGSLGKDAPIHRAIQHVGRIASVPVLGGLFKRFLEVGTCTYSSSS
jgi:hypothetical protein